MSQLVKKALEAELKKDQIMTIKNIEKFRSFLDEHLNAACYDFDACLADLERQIGETGADHYELSSHETLSGQPETISFERVDEPDGDGFITAVIF